MIYAKLSNKICTICSTGLLREDLYNEDDADVREAIRRLPEKEQQLRLFRLKRATDLSMKHSLLPREQWTTPQQVYMYQQTAHTLIGA